MGKYMRKRKKKELLEIIKTVAEAIDAVQNFIKVQNREEAEALLADCQGAVIGVGTVLEQSGMEGTQAVHFMEELCELIYQCSMTPDFEGKQQICIQIQEKLLQAEKEMEVAIVEQKLVVFLPYKASMWDSLASIWEASKDDGEWESVVMPIPYFAKKADGTLGEMEYEGDEFPADVPIMDWQQFSLEAEHPDIIFIHNPYDQYNYVTTIHPLFYSSKIKNYTDKLVYVPYFVHQNDNVADTYCVLPGTIYADVVVLQSESVREQYIRYFEAGLPDLVKRLGQEVIENKFKAWGSPKFDVGVGNKENVEMPKQWKKLIGEGSKKVVFFNTHLSGLMKAQSEQFLKKLEWVFQFLKRERMLCYCGVLIR